MRVMEPNEKPRKQFAYAWDYTERFSPKWRPYAKKRVHKIIRLRARAAIRREA